MLYSNVRNSLRELSQSMVKRWVVIVFVNCGKFWCLVRPNVTNFQRCLVPTNPTLPNVEIAPLEPLNASLESSNIFHLTFLASGFYNIIMCTTICPVLLPFTNQYAFIRKAPQKTFWCLPFVDLSHEFLQNQKLLDLQKRNLEVS